MAKIRRFLAPRQTTPTATRKSRPSVGITYGFTIGGPIPLGRWNKNKTFFFYSQEWHKVINYATFNPTAVPTTGMLTGNFIQPVCVQFSGTTCTQTSTSIPVSRINPNSAAYIKDRHLDSLPTRYSRRGHSIPY